MRVPVLLLALAFGCTRASPRADPGAPDTHAEPPALFRLEALGEAATPELIARSRGDGPDAARAIGSLGRIGDPAAVGELLRLLSDPDAVRRQAAVAALGVASLLGSEVPGAEPRLIDLWPRAAVDERITICDALGRLGTSAASSVLRAGLARDQPAPLQAAAALAIGRLGRREVAIDPDIRARLVEMTGAGETAHAATYALASEHTPAPETAVARALLGRVADRETAQLGRQGALRRFVGAAPRRCIYRAQLELLGGSDPDLPTVLVGADDDTVVAWGLRRVAAEFPRDDLTAARQTLELVNCVAAASPAAISKPRREALTALRTAVQGAGAAAPAVARTLARIDCRLAAQLAHDPAWRAPLRCADAELERDVLTAGVLADGFGGTWPERQVQLAALLRAKDPRVRVAAVAASARLWDDPAAAATVEAWMLAALDDRVLGVVGAAADAVTARFKREPPPPIGEADPLWRSLAARARGAVDSEPELYTTLVGTLAATRVAAGAGLCAPALRHSNASVRKAARDCVTALGGVDPGRLPPAAAAPPPPLDPSRLQGKTVRWVLHTDHGDLHVELDPGSAPWAVAMIVELTQRGFYDGLTFHRDVPGFVLQGGDPEGTGWGGPGFTLPSEPSASRQYDRGAVGIADAGRDTGGSQFFFMHARAPHLEGRYTWVGRLDAADLDRLELLTIGDRIRKAEVHIGGR